MDSILAARYYRKNIDTAYITRPQQRLTLKARVNLSGAGMDVYGTTDKGSMTTNLKTDFRTTLSIAAVYRGIGVGLALNPLKWSGRSMDYEINLNSYGNRFGGEIVYLSSKTFHGDMTSDTGIQQIGKGFVAQDALNLNLYYAFNYRKFSFPAAFTQSYIQRRSAGSWMLGLSSELSRVKLTAGEEFGITDGNVRMAEVGIGGGYGYNLVAGRWLFHISSVPTLIFYIHDRMVVNGNRLRMRYSLTNAIITGRGSVVYSHGNRFYGASCVFNFSSVGDENYLQIRRTKWRVRMFAGFRL
ncbi:MAG: DUF4421 family protein [Bacteroides sp.]|nr:DUF4421 family protein [Bacteroides sp.]